MKPELQALVDIEDPMTYESEAQPRNEGIEMGSFGPVATPVYDA